LPRFLRLGTLRPFGKRCLMDPERGAFAREGEDIEVAWDEYAWWRMSSPVFASADVHKMRVRVHPKIK
jgi:hypothetical protein